MPTVPASLFILVLQSLMQATANIQKHNEQLERALTAASDASKTAREAIEVSDRWRALALRYEAELQAR